MTPSTTSVSLYSQIAPLNQLRHFPNYLVLLTNQKAAFFGDAVAHNGNRHQQAISLQLYRLLVERLAAPYADEQVVEGSFEGQRVTKERLNWFLWVLLAVETNGLLEEEAAHLVSFIMPFREKGAGFKLTSHSEAQVANEAEFYNLEAVEKQYTTPDENGSEPQRVEKLSRYMFEMLSCYPSIAFAESASKSKVLSWEEMYRALYGLAGAEDSTLFSAAVGGEEE